MIDRIGRTKKPREMMYGQEKEEVVIGDNNTVFLFVRSFVDIYI